MKKVVAFILCSFFILNPAIVSAAPAGFSGGVHNEYQYEEIVFITGEPIRFSGDVDISVREKEKDGEKRVKLKFDLTAKELDEKTKLKRNVTLITEYDEKSDKGQAIGNTYVTKCKEKIEIGDDKYELDDIQFSKSDVIDKRPASDFYSGNFNGRKYYKVNKDEGEIIVTISGNDVGYENFWGNTETQTIDYEISCERLVEESVDEDEDEEETEDEDRRRKIDWKGNVRAQVSDSTIKSLVYSNNEASLSSFQGGYTSTINQEIVSKYEYDLPKMKDGIPQKSKRNRDSIKLSAKMVPELERLVVPKFRDTAGHWARPYIEKLYSLDVFDQSQTFFTPEAPMTRSEFTKGIIRACDIRTIPKGKRKSMRGKKRKKDIEESPFIDVETNDPDYNYISGGLKKGIITGISRNMFKPKSPLTRAQAITILVRALGFTNKAPTPGYYTQFSDDHRIPGWAKDSIYVAREIHLIEGDEHNRVNPNKPMTRSEASAMLVRFLEFLQKDLQLDYRENIILN